MQGPRAAVLARVLLAGHVAVLLLGALASCSEPPERGNLSDLILERERTRERIELLERRTKILPSEEVEALFREFGDDELADDCRKYRRRSEAARLRAQSEIEVLRAKLEHIVRRIEALEEAPSERR